nr:carboxypeptidase-like regulatory domain-containing protein [Myxococcota bacterium]
MIHGRSGRSFAVGIALALACGGLAACADQSGSGDDAPIGDAGTDALPGCGVFLTFDPPVVLAGPANEVRAIANVSGAPGVLTYTWQVKRGGADVAFALAQADGSAVTFAAPTGGPYSVMVAVDAPGAFCPTAQGTINVGVPGSNVSQVRLRVIPPPTVTAPPLEKLVLVNGGASFSLGIVAVDPGVVATGHVRMDATGVPAYLRFIPLGGRDAYVETFAAADGAFAARVHNQLHDVLIVPSVPGVAPRLVTGWTPGTAVLAVDAGVAVTGTVTAPKGGPVAHAKVQLTTGGVPSTLTTTDSSGAFSVRSVPVASGASLAITVTPPIASGLPRLAAASAGFTLGSGIQVTYDAGLGLRDLGGTVVQ